MPVQNLAAKWAISKRWTPALVVDGFTPIPSPFLEHYSALGITSAEAMFIIHLISHKWDEKHPFPKFATLAARMRISETAVRNHARSLERKKLLNRINRPGQSNQFDLGPLFQKLEQMQAVTPKKKRIKKSTTAKSLPVIEATSEPNHVVVIPVTE